MRPLFRPQLVNGPWGDPGLYVDVLFERRALLFDLGDIGALEPRKVLRISDVFVTHTHMDHFIGLDRLLRLRLGRERPVSLYGPAGFIAQVEHKLAAFTWNLVANYAGDFTIHAHEFADAGVLQRATFRCRERFERRTEDPLPVRDGVVLDEAAFRIRCVALDHQIPCLGFALEEKTHVNVWKNRLAEFGVEPGAWLRDLKRAALSAADDDTVVVARWLAGGARHEKPLRLGDLRRRALMLVPGEKIGYVSDVAGHAKNVDRIVELVGAADLLFIEATFLEADAAEAARKFHLTARAAGDIGRRAQVKCVEPFHFSPRYAGREAELRAELRRAFGSAAR
jgi:ribonuclease Z